MLQKTKYIVTVEITIGNEDTAFEVFKTLKNESGEYLYNPNEKYICIRTSQDFYFDYYTIKQLID